MTARTADDATLQLVPGPKPGFTLERLLPDTYYEDLLREQALAGLTHHNRWLSPMWFYDALGSQLYEAITALDAYYPFRAEAEILRCNAAAIADRTQARTVVELGSGSSTKTRLLLDALRSAGTLRRYTALDVSESALHQAGQGLLADYPGLQLRGVVTDFTAGLPVAAPEDGPRLLIFLGGTLGNFAPTQRRAFLRQVRASMGPRDVFLVGVDMVKSPETLVAAYDDETGVTAAFNRNVLNVVNRTLGADFRPRAFDHVAVWNAEEEWIEMHLRSRRVQTVTVAALGQRLNFAPGETIRTEISAKFRHSLITNELREAGLLADQWFSDDEGRFNLYLAQPDRPQLTVA